MRRSTNQNLVVYDLRLDALGNIDQQEPLAVYWRMIEQDGQREPLTWLERTFAYGYDLESKVEGDAFAFRLKALPERLVSVRRHRGRFTAFTRIRKTESVFTEAYVEVSGSLTGPDVRYVDLSGQNPRTGAAVRERIRAR